MMFLAAALGLVSCDDDRDSNPTLLTPATFVVNNPAVGEANVDLEKSAAVNLTWSQPVFTTGNAPVSVNYEVQVSVKGTFESKYDENVAANDPVNIGADYFAIGETYTSCSVDIPAERIDRAAEMLEGWQEASDVPENLKVSLRIRAYVRDASMGVCSEVLSNVVSLNVVPYYIELKDASVIMWYLVGNMFGGKWGSEIGVDALPMFCIPGYEYDKKTGGGEIRYLNYFTTGAYNNNEVEGSGFKIQPADFNWDYGMTGDNGQYDKIIYRNGGGDGGHICVSADGYYLITLNTSDNTAKLEKQDITPKVYSSICITGSFNEWADPGEKMLPYNTEGVENHAWYYVLDVTDASAEFKVKEESSWDANWGYDSSNGTVLYGTGTTNGPNVVLTTGKYCISFNDISGDISVIPL